MPRIHSLLFTLLAAIALAGCSKQTADAPAGGAQLVKVRFQTDWFPQPEHGGYYQALAKGYYQEEGLDVEILPGGPNAQVMSSVALGRADIGMTNGDDTIVAIARGVPIKIVAAEMQRDAQGILYHTENPIRELKDLNGKTVMAGAGSVWIQLVQKKYGIQFNLLPLVGDLARFMNDKTFVQQCFVTSEPYFARQRGADVGARLIAHPGYEPYRVIFAGDLYIAKHREVVRRFVRASLRGWKEYMTGDPAPANGLLQKLRPDLTPEFMAYSIKALTEYQLVLGDLLQELGVLDKPVTLADVVNFEFLPEEAWPGGVRKVP
jgi:NitT/TauT family transport system substrate-binding protein